MPSKTKGKLTIHTDDCLKVLPTLKDKSVDIVVTSPPYNINLKYNSYKDKKTESDYYTWLSDILEQLDRVLKDDGSIFINIGSMNSNTYLTSDIVSISKKFFNLQNHIIWVKSIAIKDTTFGHFKPINSTRYLNNLYEDILHLTKTGSIAINRKNIGVPFMDKANIKRFNNSNDLRCRGNVWHIPYKTITSKVDRDNHPATYPIELVTNCIKLAGYDEDTVILDPFLGSGTTLQAAKELGIHGIGIEVDPVYAEIAYNKL